MLDYAALILSLGALIFAWANRRARQSTETRLETLRGSHYRLAQESHRQIEALQNEIKSLKRQLRQASGAAAFEPTMTVGEAYETHPQAEAVFAGFHLGGCSSCAVSPHETIESAARRQGVDPEQLVASLNSLLDPVQGGRLLQQIERQPNVALRL